MNGISITVRSNTRRGANNAVTITLGYLEPGVFSIWYFQDLVYKVEFGE